MKKVITYLTIFLLLATVTLVGFKPLFSNLTYGLDLSGGFEVLYQVESIDGEEINSSKITSTYKTLLRRLDGLGISEPNITVEGEDRIRVQLAGVTNEEEAREQLSKTASLTFRDTDNNLLMTSEVLSSAKVGVDNSGMPAVSLQIKDKELFYDITKEISQTPDNRIVIWLDYDFANDSFANEEEECGALSSSNCLSVATVSQGFSSDVIIEGNFSKEEVENLVDLINSGSLPTKLTEISSRTVEASFGEETLNNTLIAGIIGISLIIIMMIIIYRFSGIISAISITIYTFLVFLTFWLTGGALSLPGIAAIILGIGMAVDANVLTFSRIKEELSTGISLKEAFKKGNKRSFTTILDSNLTTLLVAVILFIFGETSVKGFATMLIITILVTMLTMVILTRFIMKKFVNSNYFKDKTNLFIGYNINKKKKTKQRDYIKAMVPSFIFSGIIIIIGAVMFFTSGLNLGIDYQGGTSITLKTNNTITTEQIALDLEELSLEKRSIELTETITNEEEISIIINDNVVEGEIANVKDYFKEKYNATVDIRVISNTIKEELTINAISSVIIALIAIIIYISIRFRFSYALAAIKAIIHDVLIIFMVFAIFKLEISTMFIAAVLAIIGYSINDTIVTFDRLRENLNNNDKNLSNKEIVNQSIKQTLGRSITTSATTILPILALIFLGSREILNFNIALLIGLISGTYSSIMIAPAIWLIVEKIFFNKDKPKKEKKVYYDELDEKTIKGINS